jgi:hypothetical protein
MRPAGALAGASQKQRETCVWDKSLQQTSAAGVKCKQEQPWYDSVQIGSVKSSMQSGTCYALLFTVASCKLRVAAAAAGVYSLCFRTAAHCTSPFLLLQQQLLR